MRSIRLIIPALLTVALLAGCGGGSDDEATFKKDFKAVNDQLLELGQTVGRALQSAPGTTDQQLAGEFSGFAGQLDDVKRDLDALKPPDDLKPQVETLSTAVAALSKDLNDIAHAATVHDTAKAREATKALLVDSKAARDARRALAEKTGAKVGS
jgi:outer membrane murein-binding lipoprotein Lpp